MSPDMWADLRFGTKMYLRLAALVTELYQGLQALVTELYQGLQALVTRRYSGAVSNSYKKVHRGMQPSVQKCT